MRMLKKITALILVISMVLTLQGGVFIQLTNNVVKAVESANELELPYYVEATDNNDKKHIKRLKEDENEYMAIFENEDGTITCYSFLSPVQYKDSDGNLIDYDTRLKEVKNQDKKDAGYAYEIASSNVDILMPEDLISNKYITVEKDKYKIDFKPISLKENSSTTDDKYKAEKVKEQKQNSVGVEYLSNDSDNISYRYYALSNGAKEEIILNSKPESNVFQFEYKFKNIIPELQEDGRVLLLDEETSEVVGAMDSMFMYDSFTGEHSEEDGHYSESIQLSIEKKNDNKYIFTVTLDQEFLDDPDTVYPVIVDPTLVLDDYPEVKDVHTASKYKYTSYYNTTLNKLGVSSTYGTVRTFVQPYIPAGTVYDGYEVTSATFSAYNYTSYTSEANIDIYPITSSWSHSSTKWTNMPSYNSSTRIATHNFNARGRYNFNITSMVQNWQKYANDTSQGYVNWGFIVRERLENGSRYRAIYTANYGTNSYVVINYVSTDLQAPTDVSSLTAAIDEDIDNNGKAKITVSWPQTSDNPSWHNDGVKEYELTFTDAAGNFYNADGTMIPSSTPENYTPITIIHDGVTTTYSQDFVNLTDNMTYEAKIRACDNAATSNWTGYTNSGSIVVGDMLELAVSVSPNVWTTDAAPTISWTEAVDTDSIYYSIDGGAWADSGYDGIDGSGDLPALTQDGEYQIKIKGMDASGNPSAESSEVTYKLDTTIPVAAISNLTNGDNIGDRVDIVGEISDLSSGIASWTLEYGEGSTPVTWNPITTETAAVNQGNEIYEWDTSTLVAGNYAIRLISTDNVGLNSTPVTVELTKMVSTTLTAPTNLTAVADNNYTVSLDWEDGSNPAGTKYEIYRGETSDFVPDFNTNLIANDITTTYCYDYSAEYNSTYYYKVVAVNNIDETFKEVSSPTAASNQVTFTTPIETGEKLGLQNFWKFTSFGAGNGTGYINVVNGNLVFNSTDSVYPGYMLAMVMRRTYNSEANIKTSLGYGWDFSYNTRLYKEYDSVNDEWDIILKDGDGSLHEFDYIETVGGISTYSAPNGVFMELTYNVAADEYTIERNDYVTYTFNNNLQIVKLAEMNGNYLEFNYNELTGVLENVKNCDNSDNSKNQVNFTYYSSTDTGVDPVHIGLLKEMTDAAGRTYKYEYEAGVAKLKKVYMTTAILSKYYSEEYTYAAGTNKLETIKDANGKITTISYDGYARVTNVAYPDPDPDPNVTGDEKSFGIDYSVAYTTKVTEKWGTETTGHDTTYVYNANGSVTDITNALDDTTTFTYNNYYQVTSVSYQNYVDGSSTASTITTNIDYDDNDEEGEGVAEGTTGNVLSITDAEGNKTSFEYNATHVYKADVVKVWKTASTHADTNYEYYADGNLKKVTNPVGNFTEYTYYGSGLMETVTNMVVDETSTFGTKTYYTYDSEGRLYEVRQGLSTIANASLTLISKVISYDSYGNPTIVQDVNGIQSQVEYDALGRPTKTYLPDMEGTETGQHWSNNEYTTAVYDIKGNVESTTDIKGVSTSVDYDDMGRIKSTTTNVSPTITNSVSYSSYQYYNPESTNTTTCLKVTSTNAEGTQTIEYYDELGRVRKTAVWDADETEPLLKEKTRVIYEYDLVGNVATIKDLIVEIVDSGVKVISDYRETKFEYDKLNRQKATITYTDDAVPEEIRTSQDYDYAGNVKNVVTAEGNAVAVEERYKHTTTYSYDDVGRLKQVRQHDGGRYLYTNYDYDDIVSYQNLSDVTKTYVMNKVTDAAQRVRETYLDEYGRVVAEVNHGLSTTDSIKMIIERTFNIDGTVDTVNQAKPNKTDITERQVDHYTYNNWGLVTYIHYGSETSTTDVTSYEYNDHGQVKKLTDTKTDLLTSGTNTVTTEYTYDDLGRTKTVIQDSKDPISYVYNDVGQITKLTQPADTDGDKVITDYNYNDLGQLETIYHGSDIGGIITSNKIRDYDYLTTGQLKKTIDYLKFDDTSATANMTTQYLYTGLGEVKEIKYTNDTAGTTLEKYNYDYNINGNIEKEVYYQSYGGGTTRTKDFYYDPLNRLNRMDYEDDRADYLYDKVGNKIYEKYFNRGGVVWEDLYKHTDWDYNEFDQLTEVKMDWNNGEQWIGKYNYDAKGQMISKEEREYNDVWYYTWVGTGEYDENGDEIMELVPVYRYGGIDGENSSAMVYNTSYAFDKAGYLHKEHAEVSNNVFVDTYHYYNGMEQRTKKVVDLSTDDVTNYFYSGRIQLFTTDKGNGKITENILAPNGQTIASQRFDGTYANNYYFMNTDIRNSTTAILSDSYTAKKYYSYDTFGKTEENGDSNFTNFIGFTGAVSEGNDIYYMNARFYDANTSRFLSQDTFAGNAWEPWSQNLYSYAGNNPVNFIDPTGHNRERLQLLDGGGGDTSYWLKRRINAKAKPVRLVDGQDSAQDVILMASIFASMDEAAIAWVKWDMRTSVEENVEYAAIIYSMEFVCSDRTIIYGYSFTESITEGLEDEVDPWLAKSGLPQESIIRAFIHSHGRNTDKGYDSLISRKDKLYSDLSITPIYMAYDRALSEKFGLKIYYPYFYPENQKLTKKTKTITRRIEIY